MSENSPTVPSKVLAILRNLDDASFVPSEDHQQRTRFAFRLEMKALLFGAEGDPEIRIHTRNLSTGGLGFLSRRQFKNGDCFALPIKIAGTATKLVLCRVTFVRYVRGGLHEIGAEFEQVKLDPNDRRVVPREWIDLALASPASTAQGGAAR